MRLGIDEQTIPVWAARLQAEQARQATLLEGFGRDVREIKDILRGWDEEFSQLNERVACLETDRKSVGNLTKALSWLGGIGASVLAILEALRRLG